MVTLKGHFRNPYFKWCFSFTI